MSVQFDGKVVLVTGASAGIGEATARAFAMAGARVVLSDVNVQAGESVAAAIRAESGEATFVACDVTDAKQVAALMEAVIDRYGRLDCAFNNAGVEYEKGKLAEGTEEEFDGIMGVNVKGVWQ